MKQQQHTENVLAVAALFDCLYAMGTCSHIYNHAVVLETKIGTE